MNTTPRCACTFATCMFSVVCAVYSCVVRRIAVNARDRWTAPNQLQKQQEDLFVQRLSAYFRLKLDSKQQTEGLEVMLYGEGIISDLVHGSIKVYGNMAMFPYAKQARYP